MKEGQEMVYDMGIVPQSHDGSTQCMLVPAPIVRFFREGAGTGMATLELFWAAKCDGDDELADWYDRLFWSLG